MIPSFFTQDIHNPCEIKENPFSLLSSCLFGSEIDVILYVERRLDVCIRERCCLSCLILRGNPLFGGSFLCLMQYYSAKKRGARAKIK